MYPKYELIQEFINEVPCILFSPSRFSKCGEYLTLSAPQFRLVEFILYLSEEGI